jgi:DnaJ-class molecular chaperone
LNIPMIVYTTNCKKCHGSGVTYSKKGYQVPCSKCYRRSGYCRKCYGSGINYNKNKPCKRCNKGKMHANRSSSSSYSD